jgi:hypothetical protein
MTTETAAPPRRGALAADAAWLSPGAEPSQTLLRALREHVGQTAEQRVRAVLGEASRILGAPETRVVFAGHFSSGKSSVINTLIGRPLLPSSRFPETGVPCLLRSGAADKLMVVPVSPADGARGAALTTEQIAGAVKLIGKDGAHRAGVLATERLDVTLAAGPVPDGTVWVDSPGSNDTGAMNDRATAAAAAADVLVWVVNSRQPVSETEQDLLAAHLATHGPASVVFLVNAFLPEDSPRDWQEFLAEDMPVIASRIAHFVDTGTLGKSVVVMSARAAAASGSGYGADYGADFGGAHARALVTSLSDGSGEGWRATATRRFRAAFLLGPVDQWLTGLIGDERERITVGRADWAAAAGGAARFTTAARRRVEQVLARHRADASEAVIAATSATRKGSGAASAAMLETELREVWDRIAADVTAAVTEEARRHGQPALAQAVLTAKLKASAADGGFTVSGGAKGGHGIGGALAGAGAGLVAGTVVPGIGHVIGAGLGAGWGYAQSRRNRRRQRAASVAEIESTGSAAVDALTGAGAVRLITRVVTGACVGPMPPRPGDERLTALCDAQSVLTGYAAQLRGGRP